MGDALGRTHEIPDIQEEADRLTRFVNDHMWDKTLGFYFDRRADGWLSDVKTCGAYWGLMADAVPDEKLEWFLSHLDDVKTFNRPHRVPSLSADHEAYNRLGGYWLGAVWAPTNYMILKGLLRVGFDTLAHEIALNHLENVIRVFEETGTLWENYAPETAIPGDPSKPDMVGWSGLPPIAVLLETLFGLRPDLPRRRLTWDVRILEAHGVKDYPFGNAGTIDLRCEKRFAPGERPVIDVSSTFPLDLELRWGGGIETIHIQRSEHA
jgi:glycogen debranching enzyme